MSAKSKEEVVHDFRVQTIQDAAMRVIARKGMAAATIQEIAADAGIAKGTIYLYFRDRDELIEKTFERAITQLHERIDIGLAAAKTFEEQLRAMIAAKLDFFRENREFFRLYISLRIPEGNVQQQRRQKRTCQPQYQARVDQIANLLQAAMDRGEVRKMNPQRLALLIAEAANAIVIERVMEESSPKEEEDVELIAGVILEGIRRKD